MKETRKVHVLLSLLLVAAMVTMGCEDPLSRGAGTQTTIPVASVELDRSAIDLFYTSAAAPVAATVHPVYATDKSMTWSSSDATVVQVVLGSANNQVNLKPLRCGTVTVSATTTNGAKVASVVVNVNQESVAGASVATGNDKAKVSWTEPANPDYSKVRITVSSADAGAIIPAPVDVTKGTGNVMFNGLSVGKKYDFSLVAYDLNGFASTAVSVSQQTWASVPPPTAVVIDPVGDGTKIRLAWTDPGYLDMANIRIRTTSSDGGAVPGTYSDIAKGTQVALISGLTANKNYTFDLTTVDLGATESANASIATLSKPYKYKIKNAWTDKTSPYHPYYMINAYDTGHTAAHDVVIAWDTDYNSAGNYPVRTNCDIWIRMPALSNPLDRSICSFQNVMQPTKYLRVNSAAPTTAPTDVNQWYDWSIPNVPAAAREYWAWVDDPATYAAALGDASFQVVAAKNGNAAMVSLKWAGASNRYLLANNYHVLGLADTNAQFSNETASWTLEAQ